MSTRPPILYGARSEREGKPWQCSNCLTHNGSIRKLVFDVPEFSCSGCGQSFFNDNVLDFSLADVDLNGVNLIQKIFEQDEGECVACAICQVLLMMHILDCILKKKQPEDKMLYLDPFDLFDWYKAEYPLRSDEVYEDSDHKYIKMLLKLRREGIELADGTFYKIGDISSIPKDEYEQICEELADGVPLLATFLLGGSFEELGYCQIYCPPNKSDVYRCCTQSPEAHEHGYHTVVLIGVATNGEQRGFYFVNSEGLWCPRFMLEQDKTVEQYGVAKLVESGLTDNVIKLWPLGETAGSSQHRFEDEEEGPSSKYFNSPKNISLLNGL